MSNQSCVFIVESDHSLSSSIKKKLEKRGYQVCLYENGKEVLESAKHKAPVLILLDIQLPDLDGFDVLSQIRKDSATKDIPVIMITNLDNSSPKVLKTTKEYPPHLYLVKSSWTMAAMLEQIDKIIKEELQK